MDPRRSRARTGSGTSAEGLDLVEMRLPRLGVRPGQSGRQFHVKMLARLGIHEPHLTKGAGIALTRRHHVEDEHVMRSDESSRRPGSNPAGSRKSETTIATPRRLV